MPMAYCRHKFSVCIVQSVGCESSKSLETLRALAVVSEIVNWIIGSMSTSYTLFIREQITLWTSADA
ncbi:hypothetical protein PF006_g27066 [Phytophthora fragariae]|uniref:Uncharacterized protein n=1 Tax=Phytophthora fragariae TaxID=53985 RepID=A0A6A3QRF9_9STRA|nr:hypothetical protein PF006_g27066 [Phytophthora fragariae]